MALQDKEGKTLAVEIELLFKEMELSPDMVFTSPKFAWQIPQAGKPRRTAYGDK